MRLLGLVLALLCVSALVLGVGIFIESRPVPPRAIDQTLPADPSWYAHLPVNAKAATGAYVERIPVAMREKGERYSDTRLIAFLLRVANLLAATFLLCTLLWVCTCGCWPKGSRGVYWSPMSRLRLDTSSSCSF